jgi:hypothetical protein
VLTDAPIALAGMAVTLAGGAGLALGGVITGWHLTVVIALSLLVWPAVATVMLRDGSAAPDAVAWEWAGLDTGLSDEQLRSVDASLGIDSSVGAAT